MGKISLVKPLRIKDGNLYRATDKQTNLLVELGYGGDLSKLSMSDASAAIDELIAQQPATQKQLDMIAKLGGTVAGDITALAASEVIEQLFQAIDNDRIKKELSVRDMIAQSYTVIGDGNSQRFTTEEHNSLKIFDHNNSWTWYSQEGNGGKNLGGSVIDWYMHAHGCSNGEAIIELWAMLNGRGGYVAPAPRPATPSVPQLPHDAWKNDRWQRVANEALRKCQECLWCEDSGRGGRDELANRGITLDTAKAMGMGYGMVWNRKANGMMPALWLPWFHDGGLSFIGARFVGVPKDDPNANRISSVGFVLNDGDSKRYYGTRYLFGQQHCAIAETGKLDTLILVEGELNGASIFQTVHHSYHCDVVSYGPQRNLQNDHVVDVAREVAQRYKNIVVWADQPEAAIDALGTIPNALPVRSPVIDGKEQDANDLLQMGMLADVLAMLLGDLGTERVEDQNDTFQPTDSPAPTSLSIDKEVKPPTPLTPMWIRSSKPALPVEQWLDGLSQAEALAAGERLKPDYSFQVSIKNGGYCVRFDHSRYRLIPA